MKSNRIILAFTFCWAPGIVAQIQPPALPAPAAPVITDPSDLTAIFQSLEAGWLNVVTPYAYELFGALAGLDIALLGWSLWRSYNGDIKTVIWGTTDKILAIGMFLALLMNGSSWMAAIINSFIQIGKDASGVPSLSPSVILLQGFKVFGTMFGAAMQHGLFLDIPTAIALIFAGICIWAAFLVITFQFVVTQVQVFLALGMGYIFLAFGGSRWTTPYVERYFAFSFASGIKLMTLYMLVGGGWIITDTWANLASQIGLTLSGVEQAWVIAAGAVLYAGICWFASSQISAMLGGSPNLSHSDFVSFMGPMVMGTVAAGSALATAGGGAASAVVGGGSAGGSTPPTSSPGATRPPPPTAPGSSNAGGPAVHGGGGASAGTLATGFAQTTASLASRMPNGGGSGHPPHFSGFGH
jgi:type IV secretion system protein TrbL